MGQKRAIAERFAFLVYQGGMGSVNINVLYMGCHYCLRFLVEIVKHNEVTLYTNSQ